MSLSNEQLLREAKPGELLESYIMWCRDTLTEREIYFLRLGFKLRDENGWEQIAPAWIKAYREREKT